MTCSTDSGRTDADQIRDSPKLETTVASMAKIRACWSPSFSPDGTRLTFISNLTGLPQVWTVATSGGWPELITALDDQIYSVSWSPDGAWLAFVLAPGGGMNQQIYLVQPDGTGLHRLTDGGKENNWLGRWTPEGQALMIASNRHAGEAMDAYLVDVQTGQWQLAAKNQGIGILSDISRDGRLAILYRMVNRSDNDLFLIDLTEPGKEILLTPHKGPGNFGNGRFSPEGRTIFLSSDKDRELMAFARVKLNEDNQPGPIEVLVERDDAELQEFEITQDGMKAALVWNVAGLNQLAFLDLTTLELSPGPELPAEIISGLTFSLDGHFLAMTITGSASPSDIWVFDCKTNDLLQVTHSPHPGVNLGTLTRPERVTFTAHDGLELSGWLYQPGAFTPPGPIVLSFHGGPEGQERPRFHTTYQALLAQGIAVFAPNVRGSAGFGKTFVNLDNGPLRVNAIRDIKSCVDYLIKAGIADPKRIGIMGGSYGGYMTMAGLTEYPEIFAAGANLFGIVNFETFFNQTEPWMAAISKVEYGDPETEVELLRSLSPIYKIDRVKAATIVLYGANDTNVPVVEAEQTVESLKKRNIPVEYVLFPDEGHGFTKIGNQIQSTISIVSWFKEHLKV